MPSNPYLRTLYIFTIVNWIGGTAYGMYYGVFLYRHTFSLNVLALDGLFSGVGAYAGYLLGVVLIRRKGYGATIKMSFALMAGVAFATAMLTQRIAEWFILLAIIRALPGGIYTAAADAMMLRDINVPARNRMLQSTLAIEYLAGVLLPTLIGGVISWSHGYRLAFILAGIIFAAALFIPVKLPLPELHFDFRAVLAIFRRPLYIPHIANRMVSAGFNQLNAFALTIIPFLLLKNELKMGLLTSIMALAGGIVSLFVKRIKRKRQLRLGYMAYLLRLIGTTAFISIWTAPLMAAWQLLGKLITPLHDPLQQGLDIHNDSLIMGADARQKALNINVLNNTLLLIGATAGYALFFIIESGGGRQSSLLKLILISFALWRFINLTISAGINRQASALGNYDAQLHGGPSFVPLLIRSLISQLLNSRFLFNR